MGSDKSIAESAWTSSTTLQGKLKRTDEDVIRVINMLADSKHSTPFESVVLRFWIKMPISCDRQFMTHRLQSASGMSGRYRTMPSEFLEMPKDVKEILSKIDYSGIDKNDNYAGSYYIQKYNELCEETNYYYQCVAQDLRSGEKDNIITNQEFKRVREFYRGVLPQNNMTERVSIMNLRAFANFIKLRDKPEAQPEIQYVAKLMLQAVKDNNVAPVALEALERNNWII